MINYPEYQPSADEIRAFERAQRAAKLVTVADNGWPCAGVYPFLRSGEWLELHLVRTDEQVRHLEKNSIATFLIDDVLSSVPSHWFGPVATHADQLHCTVQYECQAEIIRDETEIRRHLVDLLARYQPEGRFVPLDQPEYVAQLRAICLIRLRPTLTRTKFKLGQKLSPADRGILMDHLEQRGGATDRRTIAAVRSFGSSTPGAVGKGP